MKNIMISSFLTLLSTTAFAHPGSNQLVCHSAQNSGSTQKIELSLSRSNATGTYAPIIKIKVDQKDIQLTTTDENNNYGQTYHNSPLGVITVTADVPYASHGNVGGFSVVAIPQTVKAFDEDGKPVKWTFEGEKDECGDANGKALFQAILHGYLYLNKTYQDVETQILDCTLVYNSGSAC